MYVGDDEVLEVKMSMRMSGEDDNDGEDNNDEQEGLVLLELV